MTIPGNKKPNRDDGGATHDVVESIWIKNILGEALELIMTSTDPRRLRDTLNSSSWMIKKAYLAYHLETGNLEKANSVATHILGLTEVKRAAIDANINVSQNVQILLAEIRDVPYSVLEERASDLRKIAEQKQIGSGGTEADRRGNEETGTDEVLVLEDESVQG